MKSFVLFSVSLFLISGCARNFPVSYNSPTKYSKIIGDGQAEKCDFGIFFLPPFDSPNKAYLSEAIEMASKPKGGDGLINASVDYTLYNYIFFNRACVRVSGKVVKIEE